MVSYNKTKKEGVRIVLEDKERYVYGGQIIVTKAMAQRRVVIVKTTQPVLLSRMRMEAKKSSR